MNRYERHLNERLEQQSTWSALMSSIVGGLAVTIWVVFLLAINLAFFMVAVWLVQKFLGG